MTVKLVKTYTKSETCWQNRIDRYMPVCFTRYADVLVYRHSWDFFGFWDQEVENWGEWNEVKIPDMANIQTPS